VERASHQKGKKRGGGDNPAKRKPSEGTSDGESKKSHSRPKESERGKGGAMEGKEQQKEHEE